MFFDNALTCPNHNGTEPQFPWDICPPPTADTTLAVIPFGKQPTVRSTLRLQCSLVLILEKRSFENVRGGKKCLSFPSPWTSSLALAVIVVRRVTET